MKINEDAYCASATDLISPDWLTQKQHYRWGRLTVLKRKNTEEGEEMASISKALFNASL